MFGAIAYIFVVGLVVLVIALALAVAVSGGSWRTVNRTIVLPRVPPDRLESAIYLLLSNIQGAEVVGSAGSYVMTVRRTPRWVIIPMVLTLPLGLLFFMMKTSGTMQVTMTATAAGCQVRLIGRTTRDVLGTLDKALGPLGAVEGTELDHTDVRS